MLAMVVFVIAFRWIHLSTPLISLFLLVLILLLMPTLNFLPVCFALSLLRFRLPSQLPMMFFFFSSRRRHTICSRDWSSDVCSSDLPRGHDHPVAPPGGARAWPRTVPRDGGRADPAATHRDHRLAPGRTRVPGRADGDPHRSEERRVGKECRSRWSAYH